MKKVQILGPGCAKCKTLLEHTEAAAKALGVTIELEKVTDLAAIMRFGVMTTPALVVDGNVCEIPDYYKNKYNVFADEPRCAIGQIGELEYLLVVVDGRRKDSDGCTCAELADFMATQGCTMAYNLDGGNSALMWFGGENYSEKTVKAERSVSDIIYFATAIDAANTEE